jgi:hypothetical protein
LSAETEAPQTISEASDRAMDLIETIDVDELIGGGNSSDTPPDVSEPETNDESGDTHQADEAAEKPDVEAEAEQEGVLGVKGLEDEISREEAAWEKYRTQQYEEEKRRGWEAQQYERRPEPPRQGAPKSKYLTQYADEDLTETEVAARRELSELRSVVSRQEQFIQQEQSRRSYEESQRRAAAEMAKYEQVFSSKMNPAVAKHAVRMVSQRIGGSSEPESLVVKRVVREVQDLAKEFHRMSGGKAAKPRKVTGGRGGRGAPRAEKSKRMTAEDLDKGRVQDAALRALRAANFGDI